MSIAWIRKTYGVPAKRGTRVRYTGDCTARGEPRLGTIGGAAGQYLRIRMDGDSFSGRYHPTYALEYLP